MTSPHESIRTLAESGDVKGATEAALNAFGPRVLRYLRSILHDEEDVADAFQAFAEAVWKGLPHFRWEASFATWSYRIAYHAALNVCGEAWRRHRHRLATTAASMLAEDMRTKSFIRVERQRADLEKLLSALSIEDQTLFALRIGQRLDWGDVAAVLSRDGEAVDVGTVAKRFSRLKERLAQAARDGGFVD